MAARDGVPATGALREHLRATLPECMLPQQFVQTDAVPQREVCDVRDGVTFQAIQGPRRMHRRPRQSSRCNGERGKDVPTQPKGLIGLLLEVIGIGRTAGPP